MMTAVIMREARTQFRSGLTWLYLGMPAIWILIVRLLPVQARSITVLIGIYSDPVMLGSLFTGAFLARERDQGLFGAWAVTPMDAGSWLAARILLIAIQGRSAVSFSPSDREYSSIPGDLPRHWCFHQAAGR
jgi:fluoroquinolone transport system permease protein